MPGKATAEFAITSWEATPYGAIIPGSATGELAGLRGSAEYRHDDQGAILTLHYDP